MMRATELIAQYFDEKEVRFRLEDREDVSAIIANIAVDYTSFAMHFYSQDEENDVSVRIPNFVRYGNKSTAAVLKVAAECNSLYRYAKFTVDTEEHSVRVEFDFPEETEDDAVGPIAYEIFRRLMQICDEAFPKFMEAIWGREEQAAEYNNIVFHDFQV